MVVPFPVIIYIIEKGVVKPMNGVIKMAKEHQINYVKPNMSALPGRIGREIFETIMNTPKPDLTELNRRSDEVESRILAARKAKQK